MGRRTLEASLHPMHAWRLLCNALNGQPFFCASSLFALEPCTMYVWLPPLAMQKAAQESRDAIAAALAGSDMVFVTVSLRMPRVPGLHLR